MNEAEIHAPAFRETSPLRTEPRAARSSAVDSSRRDWMGGVVYATAAWRRRTT